MFKFENWMSFIAFPYSNTLYSHIVSNSPKSVYLLRIYLYIYYNLYKLFLRYVNLKFQLFVSVLIGENIKNSILRSQILTLQLALTLIGEKLNILQIRRF